MRKATGRAKRRGSLFVFLGVRDSLQHWGHSGLEALFTHTLGFQDNSGRQQGMQVRTDPRQPCHMRIVVGKRKDQGTDRTETLIVLQSTLRQ